MRLCELPRFGANWLDRSDVFVGGFIAPASCIAICIRRTFWLK
jgi:hypothetical protein